MVKEMSNVSLKYLEFSQLKEGNQQLQEDMDKKTDENVANEIGELK